MLAPEQGITERTGLSVKIGTKLHGILRNFTLSLNAIPKLSNLKLYNAMLYINPFPYDNYDTTINLFYVYICYWLSLDAK